MSIQSRVRVSQGELFLAPAQPPHIPAEAYQRMVRLLARMLNEHLQERLMDGAHRVYISTINCAIFTELGTKCATRLEAGR